MREVLAASRGVIEHLGWQCGQAYREAKSIRPPPATPARVGYIHSSNSYMRAFVSRARVREGMGAMTCPKLLYFQLQNSVFLT